MQLEVAAFSVLFRQLPSRQLVVRVAGAISGRQCEGASRDEEACSLKAAPKLLNVFDSLIFNQVNPVHPATFPGSHAGLPTGLSRGAGKRRSQTHSGDFVLQDCELGDWSAWTTCNELSFPRTTKIEQATVAVDCRRKTENTWSVLLNTFENLLDSSKAPEAPLRCDLYCF